jgi:hypothetical protein
VHGEVVVAADQAEADVLVGRSKLTNHSQPDLVILANLLPALTSEILAGGASGTQAVTLPFVIKNLGSALSAETTLSVFATDPRVESPEASLVPPVAVPALVPGGQADVSLLLPASLLSSDDRPSLIYISVAAVPAAPEFDLDNNTVMITF